MPVIWGIGFAALMAAASAYILGPTTENLPWYLHVSAYVAVIAAVAITSFLAGAAIIRRVRTPGGRPRQFMTVALAISGAVFGGVVAGTLTLAYIIAYGTWPSSWLTGALYVLAVPILSFSAAVMCGIAALIVATMLGTFLRVLFPVWR